MKQLLIFIIVISTSLIHAKCIDGGFTIWPENNKLCIDGIIMLEAFGNCESVVRNLNTKYNIYLKSDNDKIKLIIQDQQSGDINTSQVLLKPEKGLIVGKKYEIIIDSLNFEQLYNLNKCHPNYTISKDAAPKSLIFEKTPTLINCVNKKAEDGLEEYAVFNLNVNTEEMYLVKVTLINPINKSEEVYYYKHQNDQNLYIGHSMCGGAFYLFLKNNTMQLNFQVISQTGMVGSFASQPITFSKPN